MGINFNSKACAIIIIILSQRGCMTCDRHPCATVLISDLKVTWEIIGHSQFKFLNIKDQDIVC